MGDKLRGVPIGDLHSSGDGLLVNDSGTFMIDEAVIVTPEMIEQMMVGLRTARPKGVSILCSGPSMLNPFYIPYHRKMMRERRTHMYLELWSLVGVELEDNLMYQGIRHMLWLEDIEDEEMFPSLNQYNCNYCAFDALNFTEVMTCHPQENSWVIRTNFGETYDPEWGFGAEWTETIICPRCGHISTWGTGYP